MTNEQENNLKKALDTIPQNIREDLKIKEFSVHTVATDEERSVTRYPFLGIYIEVSLKSEIATRESEMRNVIEKAIGEKLSCTCSPEMAGCHKAVYRVDFEMQCVD